LGWTGLRWQVQDSAAAWGSIPRLLHSLDRANVGLDARDLQLLDVGRAPVAIVQSNRLRLTHFGRNGPHGGYRFPLVIDMIRYRVAGDEAAVLIHLSAISSLR
jgi:hypothetical protein